MLVIVQLLDGQTGRLHQQASQCQYRLLAILVAQSIERPGFEYQVDRPARRRLESFTLDALHPIRCADALSGRNCSLALRLLLLSPRRLTKRPTWREPVHRVRPVRHGLFSVGKTLFRQLATTRSMTLPS